MSERFWKWYLRFGFIGGGTIVFLGIFELLFSPNMMATDTQQGLFDMLLGCIALMGTLFAYSLWNSEWTIAQLQKMNTKKKAGGK